MGCFIGKYNKTNPDIDKPLSRFHSKSENHLLPPPNTAMIPENNPKNNNSIHKMNEEENNIQNEKEDNSMTTISKDKKENRNEGDKIVIFLGKNQLFKVFSRKKKILSELFLNMRFQRKITFNDLDILEKLLEFYIELNSLIINDYSNYIFFFFSFKTAKSQKKIEKRKFFLQRLKIKNSLL